MDKKDIPYEFRFRKCRRGFLIETNNLEYGIGQQYAFDRIEDAGRWVVEQYTDLTPNNG